MTHHTSRPMRLAMATVACSLIIGVIGAAPAQLALSFTAAAQPAHAAAVVRPVWVVTATNPAQVKITGGTAKERSAVRGYLKKWAKNTHIDQVSIGKCAHSGLTTMYLTGLSRICVHSGLKANQLRYVIAHEIAHAAQMFAYRGLGTSYDHMTLSLGAVFGGQGTRALENAADCAAHALTGTKAYNHYTKKCTSAQLKAAKRLMAGDPI